LSSEVLNREETVIFGVVVQADFSPINTAYIEIQGKALILALSANLGSWRATSDFAPNKQLCQVKLRRDARMYHRRNRFDCRCCATGLSNRRFRHVAHDEYRPIG
jgi:hypothetical protein